QWLPRRRDVRSRRLFVSAAAARLYTHPLANSRVHRVSNMATPGKVAVVTGGGSGIGKAAALALAADGWRVAVTGRRLESLQGTVKEGGSNVLAIQGDVTDPKSVHELFSKV